MYDREEKLKKFLGWVDELATPALRAGRRSKLLLGMYYRRDVFPVHVESRGRVVTVVIDVPGRVPKRPIVWHAYLSTQECLPIWPKQLPPKIRRLKKAVTKFTAQSDRAFFMLCRAGFTPGTREILRTARIMPATSLEDILKTVVKYFKTRLIRLREALRGKRLFGPLAILVYMLEQLLREYGGSEESYKPLFQDEALAFRAVESGISVV